MSKLWLYFLPIMFMPNPGLDIRTGAGTFEISDFLAPVMLFFLLLAEKSKQKILLNRMMLPFLSFLLVALLSVLVIPLVYDGYPNPFKVMLVSMIKLIKFCLYAYLGIAIARQISDPENNRKFHYSLLFCGVITSVGLIASSIVESYFPFMATVEFYKAANQMSVVIAMQLSYLGILFLEGYGDKFWRRLAAISFMLMITGQFMTEGRGGWLALILGFVIYNFYRPMRGRNLISIMAGLVITTVMYFAFPPFAVQVNNTFFRDEAYMKKYNVGVGGVDDGGRLSTWKLEFKKFINRPILGTGFFHRGQETKLWSTGSHNFFLQILLETGLLGIVSLFYILIKVFDQARRLYSYNQATSLAYRISFVAFFLGALGGEYFYGGLGLLTFFLIYAPVGSIPIAQLNSHNESSAKT